MSPRLEPGEQAVAEQIGRTLARCRRKAGMSTAELGRRADLSRLTVWIIERGQRLSKFDTVLQLAGGLDVDLGGRRAARLGDLRDARDREPSRPSTSS